MLKKIPPILSPELLKILCEMGHGDELVLADGNFPSASCSNRLVRADGHMVAPLLEGILTLFPLESGGGTNILYMSTGGDTPPIWQVYEEIIKKENPYVTQELERFDFYERAKKAYAVVATSEGALFANIILKKGVI